MTQHASKPGSSDLGVFTAIVTFLFCFLMPSPGFSAAPAGLGMSSHAGDHDFAFPREAGVELTSSVEHIRRAWSNPTHTGFIKGGSGTAIQLLDDGFSPAYGESAGPILSDGVLLVSWSQPSGEVKADLDRITDRYFRNRDRNERLLDSYMRVDADWHTLALDAETGKKLWHRIEPSASINFVSSKRDHNGITGAARDGIYVTITILGRVFAYDLKTGETRWTTTLEEWNKLAQGAKDELMASRTVPGVGRSPFGHKRSGAFIVDGIAVLPDLRGGLIGVRLRDGSKVWQTAGVLHDQATPRPWRHEGKTWLVCHNASRRGNGIHLLDPLTGRIQWTHEAGFNPGELLMGEGYILLNADPTATQRCVYTCYRLTLEGPKKLWALEDTASNSVEIRADRGAERKGVIRGGILYVKLGEKNQGRMASVDLATGKELDAAREPAVRSVENQPFIAEDKLFLQLDSSHSGQGAGLRVYQLGEAGQIRHLGRVMYEGLGIRQITDYQYPIEMPYAGGRIFLRGRTQIAAIDLTAVTDPKAEIEMEHLFGGFRRPVRVVMFADSDGMLRNGRLESPPRNELGIVGTPNHRADAWTPLTLAEDVKLGAAFEVEVEIEFVAFSFPATIIMEAATADEWTGRWVRRFTGWEETITHQGRVHDSSRGGFKQRVWPTDWLEHQPLTAFSDLPEGQQRVFLQLHAFTPASRAAEGPRNMTICLDHDGRRVVAAVGGAFSYNQSYHEIDVSELVVTDKGIKGTALVVLNPDRWVPGDSVNEGSLAGRLKLDITFGEPDAEGIYSVSGTWSVEWGLQTTQSGAIRAKLSGTP